MIHTSKNPPKISGTVYRFKDAFIDMIRSDCTIHGVLLGGAHSKSLNNANSDYDIDIIYDFGIYGLLDVNPSTLTINWPYIKGKNWIFEDNEFDLNFFPLITTTSSKRQLLKALYVGNGKLFIDMIKHLPVHYSPLFSKLRDFLINEYILSGTIICGYCHGYAKSQLLKHHHRKKDFVRRAEQSLEENSATPVVKQIIEGLNIGLTGCDILAHQIISNDFYDVLDRWIQIFPEYLQLFIVRCYLHKVDKEPIIGSIKKFVEESRPNRETIFEIIEAELKRLKDETDLPWELTKSQKRQNEEGLNSLLRNMMFKEIREKDMMSWIL